MHGEPHERPLGCSEHLRGRVSCWAAICWSRRACAGDRRGASRTSSTTSPRPRSCPASWERPARDAAGDRGRDGGAPGGGPRRDPGRPASSSAASGAMFGEAPESPQSESTPCRPTTPYAIAKLAAHQLAGAMREHEGLHACSGILFNHESERRPRAVRHAHDQPRGGGRSRSGSQRGADARGPRGGARLVVRRRRDARRLADAPAGAARDYVLASGVGHTVAELARDGVRVRGTRSRAPRARRPKLVRGVREHSQRRRPDARRASGWGGSRG